MKLLLAVLLFVPVVLLAACKEGYVPTDVDGVCQAKPIELTNPDIVSNEKHVYNSTPAYLRENIVVEAPNLEKEDRARMQEIREADQSGKRKAKLK